MVSENKIQLRKVGIFSPQYEQPVTELVQEYRVTERGRQIDGQFVRTYVIEIEFVDLDEIIKNFPYYYYTTYCFSQWIEVRFDLKAGNYFVQDLGYCFPP